jgi:hypothetical protein
VLRREHRSPDERVRQGYDLSGIEPTPNDLVSRQVSLWHDDQSLASGFREVANVRC